MMNIHLFHRLIQIICILPLLIIFLIIVTCFPSSTFTCAFTLPSKEHSSEVKHYTAAVDLEHHHKHICTVLNSLYLGYVP